MLGLVGAVSGVGGSVHAVMSDLLLDCCNAEFLSAEYLCV